MPERDAFGLPADPEGSRALTARPVSDSERFEMSIEQDSESHPHSLGEAHSEHVMTAPGLNAVDPMSAAALPTFGVSALRTPASGVPLVGSERSGHQLTGDYDALQILLQASAAAESLQQRFSELQQRRSELIAEQQQLETDRRTLTESSPVCGTGGRRPFSTARASRGAGTSLRTDCPAGRDSGTAADRAPSCSTDAE